MTTLLSDLTTLPNLTVWADLGDAVQGRLRSAVPTAEIIGVVQPETQAALAAAIGSIAQSGHTVLPYGNGTKLNWGGLVEDSRGIVGVSTAKLDRLVDHAVDDMTVTVEAGMKLTDLQKTLAAKGQFLTIDPRFISQGATIGGVIATADTGSLRHRYGGVRDVLLGVTFARSDGELVQAGGRVVKNVAGYDLMKLMTGSYGTLGVMTQVTLRTYPVQAMSQTLVLTGTSQALDAVAQGLLDSVLTPLSVDWLSPQAMTDLGLQSGLGLIVRFESVAESVAAQAQRLRDMAQRLDVTAIDHPEAELWQGISAIGESGAVICKIGLKGAAAVSVLGVIVELVPDAVAIVHGGSGLGRLVLSDGAKLGAVRSICEAAGGFLSVLVAEEDVKGALDVWGMRGNGADLMGAVRQEFDRGKVLSPGRFGG
jgi:glycolate oxidase FAD binding subunit